MRLLYLLLICFATVSCSDYPRDAENTLKRVRNNVMRVGVSSDMHLAVSGKEPQGQEADMARAFAKKLNAAVWWHHDSQWNLVQLLNKNEIDLAIGGFTEDSPLKKKAGFSRPYTTDKIRLGARSRNQLPGSAKGLTVTVLDRLTAAEMRKEGAVTIITDSLSGNEELIAVSEKILQHRGYVYSDKVYRKVKRVFVVPHGENAFLIELEKFLRRYE